MSPPPPLPIELINLILLHIRSLPSSQTLKTCSLVCRSWLPYARYLLFGRIVLRNLGQAEGFLGLIGDTESGSGVGAQCTIPLARVRHLKVVHPEMFLYVLSETAWKLDVLDELAVSVADAGGTGIGTGTGGGGSSKRRLGDTTTRTEHYNRRQTLERIFKHVRHLSIHSSFWKYTSKLDRTRLRGVSGTGGWCRNVTRLTLHHVWLENPEELYALIHGDERCHGDCDAGQGVEVLRISKVNVRHFHAEEEERILRKEWSERRMESSCIRTLSIADTVDGRVVELLIPYARNLTTLEYRCASSVDLQSIGCILSATSSLQSFALTVELRDVDQLLDERLENHIPIPSLTSLQSLKLKINDLSRPSYLIPFLSRLTSAYETNSNSCPAIRYLSIPNLEYLLSNSVSTSDMAPIPINPYITFSQIINHPFFNQLQTLKTEISAYFDPTDFDSTSGWKKRRIVNSPRSLRPNSTVFIHLDLDAEDDLDTFDEDDEDDDSDDTGAGTRWRDRDDQVEVSHIGFRTGGRGGEEELEANAVGEEPFVTSSVIEESVVPPRRGTLSDLKAREGMRMCMERFELAGLSLRGRLTLRVGVRYFRRRGRVHSDAAGGDGGSSEGETEEGEVEVGLGSKVIALMLIVGVVLQAFGSVWW